MFSASKKGLIRRLAETERRVAELTEWRTHAEHRFGRGYREQLALSGEITTSLRRSAEISQRSFGMLGAMQAFEREFEGATADLSRIDGQIGALSGNVAATGAAVNQTSAAVEQISASINRISDESARRYEDIRGLAQLSKTGQAEMAATLDVIRDITSGIDDLRSFLEIIDDIAGKTSILSMNAAIQAAHAGEVGKGFAVVADEIRRLAESSASSASGISQRLNGLVEAIDRAQVASRKTADILALAEDKASVATGSFREIVEGGQELARGASEMLGGIAVLREASEGMSGAAQQIASNSRAITDKVKRLRAESRTLETTLSTVRRGAAELNGSGNTLTQTTVRQLKDTREALAFDQPMDPAFARILILQHMGWVTRVRGVLDGTIRLEASAVADHHQCEFGRWLDGPGKGVLGPLGSYSTVYDTHERLHSHARTIVALAETPTRAAEAEAQFPGLVELSESLVATLEPWTRAVPQGEGQGN